MNRLLTPRQAADHLAVSRSTIYTLMSEGRLPWIQINGVRRIDPAALAAFLTAQRRGQAVSGQPTPHGDGGPSQAAR